MEPAAPEGLGRGLGVLEIALHHDVAAEHDLAHGLAIGGHALHRLGIHHGEILERMVANALPRLLGGARRAVEQVPVGLPVIDHRRAIGFGQAIEMRDVEPLLGHGGEHRFRRRRRGGEELHLLRQRALLGIGRAEDRRHDDGGAAEMGDRCFASASQMRFDRTQRSVTWVPPTTESDQGKHQPLQWNMGSVQR